MKRYIYEYNQVGDIVLTRFYDARVVPAQALTSPGNQLYVVTMTGKETRADREKIARAHSMPGAFRIVNGRLTEK